MSVRSTSFGAVHLSAKDAEKFLDQLSYGRPKQTAVQALARGKHAAAQFVKDGFAPLKRTTR